MRDAHRVRVSKPHTALGARLYQSPSIELGDDMSPGDNPLTPLCGQHIRKGLMIPEHSYARGRVGGWPLTRLRVRGLIVLTAPSIVRLVYTNFPYARQKAYVSAPSSIKASRQDTPRENIHEAFCARDQASRLNVCRKAISSAAHPALPCRMITLAHELG